MCEISAIGVIFLNLIFMMSRHDGTYLSNRIVRLALSDWTSRVSIHELTNLTSQGTQHTNALIHDHGHVGLGGILTDSSPDLGG